MNRFDGKELINRPVSDGIRKPEELINLALSGTAPVFHGDGKKAVQKKEMRMVLSDKEFTKI